jgi:hypothetical protein
VKKLVFVAALILAVALPASAENPIRVYVNGLQLTSEAVIINERVYVPLRAVSESLGANVGWDDAANTAYIATQRDALTDIEIVGDASFQKEMRDALELLRDKAPEDYEFVGMYVRKIVLDTGYETRPYTQRIDMEVHVPSNWKPDAYWWAGCIRHEAQHIYQRYDIKQKSITEDERDAWQKNIDTLHKIGAPSWMVDYYRKAPESKWWEQNPTLDKILGQIDQSKVNW